MKIGYIRVSTKHQNFDTQKDALDKYDIDKLYEEKESGRKTDRPVLKEVLEYIRPGDTLVVYDLSRLGRTIIQVMQLIDKFHKENIGFISIKENIDINTPSGRAMIGFLSVFNQMQVEIQNEKVKAGLESARARGRVGGRKQISKDKIKQIRTLYESKDYTIDQIASIVGVSKRTIFNYTKKTPI